MAQFNARDRRRLEAIQRRIDYISDQEAERALNDYEKAELAALRWLVEQVHELTDQLEVCRSVVAGQRDVIEELRK